MITIEPTQAANATVIWLHGLGASGHDFEPIVPELKLPETLPIRFIFPHAPVRPVTLNGGMPMPAWYDIFSLERFEKEDETGIKASRDAIQKMIKKELGKGIDASRIILAGFSQGGAIALYTGLTSDKPLGGVMALSTYLPLAKSLNAERQAATTLPIFMAHGTHDPVLPLHFGSESADWLKNHGFPVKWKTYPMEHSVCLEEVQDISTWLQNTLST